MQIGYAALDLVYPQWWHGPASAIRAIPEGASSPLFACRHRRTEARPDSGFSRGCLPIFEGPGQALFPVFRTAVFWGSCNAERRRETTKLSGSASFHSGVATGH